MSNFERATKLIQAATGDEYGDGLTVTNIGVGFADGSYGTDNELWVMGDWNPKRFRRDGEPELSNVESLPVRLGDALDKYAGATLLWLDEWATCDECYKIVRTQPDSYSWRAPFVWTESNELICEACATFDDVEWRINDSSFALTFNFDLEAEGFVKYNPKHSYESGFHPGQTDDPEAILAAAHADGWVEGIFAVPSVGQFDVSFDLWVRSE